MSANIRKTAFARVPRFAGTNNIGNKTNTVRIDKRFLDQLTSAQLAPEVSTVLTKTGAKLRLEIGANGKGDYQIVQNDGSVLGDAADLLKVQTLGTFINEQRKAVLKSSVSTKTKKFLAAIVEGLRVGNVLPNVKFTKPFVDVFRGVNSQMDILTANYGMIEALECEGANATVKAVLLESALRSRVAVVGFLAHRATLAEGEEPQKLNDFLLKARVLTWVFTRLTAQKMQLNVKGFELRHVLFPKDPTKGLAITFRELRDENLKDNQGGILGGLKPYHRMFHDDFIRGFCNIPTEWDIDAFGPKDPAKVLGNIPILVPPFAEAIVVEEFLNLLNKADNGLNWQAGNNFNPANVLKFIGTIPKRAAMFVIGQPHRRPDLMSRVFPGFNFNVTDESGRGAFSQAVAWVKTNNVKVDWFGIAAGGRVHADLRWIVKAIMATPPEGRMNGLVNEVFPQADVASAFVNGANFTGPDPWAAFAKVASDLSDNQVKNLLDGRLEANLEPKKKGVKDDAFNTARSSLGVQGEALVRELKTKGYIELSNRMAAWLRTFFTSKLQNAVAESIKARLEAYLSRPVEFDPGDLIGAFEGINSGWADDDQPNNNEDPRGDDDEDEVIENPDEA